MSATGRGRERDEHDFYETPAWCVHRLLEAVPQLPGGAWLEPCAGKGAIIRAVNEVRKDPIHWTAVEIDPSHRDDLCPLSPHVVERPTGQRRAQPLPFVPRVDLGVHEIETAASEVVDGKAGHLATELEHIAMVLGVIPDHQVRPVLMGHGVMLAEADWRSKPATGDGLIAGRAQVNARATAAA